MLNPVFGYYIMVLLITRSLVLRTPEALELALVEEVGCPRVQGLCPTRWNSATPASTGEGVRA